MDPIIYNLQVIYKTTPKVKNKMFRMYYWKNSFLKCTTFNRARQKIDLPEKTNGTLAMLQYKG